MDSSKNKYRIPSSRLATWDYGSSGAYFITICTAKHMHRFGKVDSDGMKLNRLGEIVNIEWENTIALRPDMNLELGEYVVMPNHFHGILLIGANEFNRRRDALPGVFEKTDLKIHSESSTKSYAPFEDAQQRVSTGPLNKFGPQSKNLASIIRGFKSAVTGYATRHNIEFKWQERFHDHIINSHDEYTRIAHYIYDNPANWNNDKFYSPE
jgi:putative transposase